VDGDQIGLSFLVRCMTWGNLAEENWIVFLKGVSLSLNAMFFEANCSELQ